MSKIDRINKRLKKLAAANDSEVGTKDKLDSFLIFTEGTKTEPNYFYSFPLYPSSKIEVVGTGRNTVSLVEEAVRRSEELKKKGEDFSQKWVVFDKDSFSSSDYDNAIAKAHQRGFKVAQSNECFELWFLLHYIDLDSALTRQGYFEKLSENLGVPYEKNCLNMYEILQDNKEIAKKRATILKGKWESATVPEHQKNPVTYVVDLVHQLDINSKDRFLSKE